MVASRPTIRGAAAAEGITNSGRLLGLGMALGIGAEVFGSPGACVGCLGGAVHIVSRINSQALVLRVGWMMKSCRMQLFFFFFF